MIALLTAEWIDGWIRVGLVLTLQGLYERVVEKLPELAGKKFSLFYRDEDYADEEVLVEADAALFDETPNDTKLRFRIRVNAG